MIWTARSTRNLNESADEDPGNTCLESLFDYAQSANYRPEEAIDRLYFLNDK